MPTRYLTTGQSPTKAICPVDNTIIYLATAVGDGTTGNVLLVCRIEIIFKSLTTLEAALVSVGIAAGAKVLQIVIQ